MSTSGNHTTGSGPLPSASGGFTRAAAEVEDLLGDGRLGGPGRVLTPLGLADATGHPAVTMAYALKQLAAKGAVERSAGRWTVPDERARERSQNRARRVLQTMIERAGYPPGSVLPSTDDLSRTLLTEPDAVNAALDELARHALLHADGSRFTVTAHRPNPPGPADQLDVAALIPGHRHIPAVATPPDRFTLQQLRDTARAQWENAQPLTPAEVNRRETLQRDLLRRLTLSARRHLNDHPRPSDPVHAACARAVAAAGSPMTTLGDRHWRSAVLAHLLADALSPPPAAQP
ncbi:hypothetical protein [Streptomyces sp. CFMR 7]|uniref:hypothetical protein n=1 Tax=Streptomyces sp. CFMR 7 TaxID=1649184 RepID=UPI00119FDF54|nr:hypothetical protein [Streptomyces sp. CFMR 7]